MTEQTFQLTPPEKNKKGEIGQYNKTEHLELRILWQDFPFAPAKVLCSFVNTCKKVYVI